MDQILHLPLLFHYIGMMNVLIATFGVFTKFKQAMFFLRPENFKFTKDPLRRKLGCSFLAGAFIYFMILILGLGINIELTINQWMIYNVLLGAAMLFGLLTFRRLYNHFKEM